jgi:hypothetical protein
MKASTIIFFLFFTPIFNLQNQYSMEQHKIDQLRALEEKYQELDALYSQHQELIDKYMKPELLQNFKKLGLFIEKEQEKLPQVDEDITQEEATTQESLSGLQQVQGDLGEVEEGNYEVKSISESLKGVMDDGEMGIGPKKLYRIIKKNLPTTIQSLRDTIINDENLKAGYQITKEGLISDLNDNKFKTPFGKALVETFANELKDPTIAGIDEALERTQKYWLNKANVEAHYNNNSEAYADLDDPNLDLDKNNVLNDLNKFGTIKKELPTNITDAEYPKVKEAEEARLAKAEARIDKFRDQYAEWYDSCNAINASIEHPDYMVPKYKFIAEVLKAKDSWVLTQPELAMELMTTIVGEVTKDMLSIKDCIDAMAAAVNLSNIKTPELIIYKRWEKSRIFPNFNMLKTSIQNLAEDVNQTEFTNAYMRWFQRVGTSLDTLMNEKSLSKLQQFNKKDLLNDLEAQFNSNTRLSVLLPTLSEGIRKLKGSYPTLEELNIVWKSSLYNDIVSGNTLEKEFYLVFKNEANEDSSKLELIVNNLDTALSGISADTIKTIFYQNRRILPKPAALANGSNLSFDVELGNIYRIKEGTKLTITIPTEIIRLEKGKDIIAVIPKKPVVNATSGKLGYEFGDVEAFASESPFVNSSNKKECITHFEFKIPFNKSKGSNTTGGEHSLELSAEVVAGVGVEVGHSTYSSEEQNTDFNFTPEGMGLVISESYTDGEENSIVGNASLEVALGTAATASTNYSTTTELGEDTGVIVIKLPIYAEQIDDSTLKVSVDFLFKEWISSPNSKGFKLLKNPKKVEKEMIWKK